MAGVTHFNKVCGVNGVYAGTAGSETLVATTAATYAAGNIIANASGIKNQVLVYHTMYNTTTAASVEYTLCPVAGTITSGYVVYSVAAGTAKTVTVASGSAGDDLIATAATGTQVAGGVVSMVATTASQVLTAGQSLKITLATCATAQAQVDVVLVVTKS